jgi:hypothetical protein
MRNLATTTIILGFFMAPTLAQACNWQLSASNVNITWGLSFNYQAVQVTVTKTTGPSCDFSLAFTMGGAADFNSRRMTFGANTLRYQLYRNAGLTQILMDLPNLNAAANTIQGTMPSGNQQSTIVTYYVQIPSELATTPTLRPSGSYVDSYAAKVYEGLTVNNNDNPKSTANLTITTTMPKIMEVSLVPTGTSFNPDSTNQTMNYGTLSTGQSRTVDLKVRSNAGYSVTLSAQNNGVFKHSNPAVSTTVPYSLYVNSILRNMSSSATTPVVVAAGSGQTALSGINHPVEVITGSPANKISGNYSDNITVTAITTE